MKHSERLPTGEPQSSYTACVGVACVYCPTFDVYDDSVVITDDYGGVVKLSKSEFSMAARQI